MRSIKLLVSQVFVYISVPFSHASEQDSSLQFRNLRQQVFTVEYVKNHEAVSGNDKKSSKNCFM